MVKEIQKNMEFSKIIFQTQKTMQFKCTSWKVMEISLIDFFLQQSKKYYDVMIYFGSLGFEMNSLMMDDGKYQKLLKRAC